MSDFIKILKDDHKKLVSSLREANKIGIASSAGKKYLLQIRSAFTRHLQREDNWLYPKLQQVAKTDERLRVILTEFALGMEQATVQIKEFYSLLDDQHVDDTALATAFVELCKLLSQRIQREEMVLYAEYSALYAPNLL